MNNKFDQVIALWRQSEFPPDGPVSLCDQLVGGTVNQAYLIDVLGEQYVVRIRKPLGKTFPRDWGQELMATSLAASQGLAPELVFHSTDPEAMISRYGGQTKKDSLTSELQIDQLGARLAEVHAIALPPDAISEMDYMQAIEGYSELALSVHSGAEKIEAIRKELAGLMPLFGDETRYCLVHHDLVRENVIWSGGTPSFVDWEYARRGHPDFDLYTLIDSFGLAGENQARLISAYTSFCREGNGGAQRDFKREASGNVIDASDIERGTRFVRLLGELWSKAMASQPLTR